MKVIAMVRANVENESGWVIIFATKNRFVPDSKILKEVK